MVVATYNRASRLTNLLAALRAQTLPRDRFEVIVVDDASTDGTAAALEHESQRGELGLKVIHRERNGGWAAARDQGWRLASADVVAFTDDDCEPDPDWLAAGLRAFARQPQAIVQGRTEPMPGEFEQLTRFSRPFTRTIRVPEPDPAFQMCNVFYPRSVLERTGGFDTQAFVRAPGEDSDLAWRAIEAGAATAFSPEARVYHAVNVLGPLGKLRHAARWDMKVYARHPELRRAHFNHGIFWKRTHLWLCGAVLGTLLPSRRAALRSWLQYPYMRSLYARGKLEGGGILLAPYYLLYDLVEVFTVVRSAIRYRTPML